MVIRASIAVNASIPPITFTTAGFHVDWEPLATLREVESITQEEAIPPHISRLSLPPRAVSVGEHWEIDRLRIRISVIVKTTRLKSQQLDLWNDDEIGRWAFPTFAATTTIMH